MTELQRIDDLFCNLADPEADAIEVSSDLLSGVLQRARSHGVSPIVLRKLAGYHEPAALSEMRLDVEACIVMTLKLRMLAKQITRFVEELNLSATIVKGPVFAERIYRNSGDRPFTDLDLLCTDDARLLLAEHLKDAGFVQAKRRFFDKSERNHEDKWIRGDSPQLLIELHRDLVHYASLRRRTGFTFRDLIRIGNADPQSPLCLFFTSVVHAALGHKFHQLRLLVDVLQAFRHLSVPDRQKIADTAALLHLRVETTSCLRLIAELFQEGSALEFAKTIPSGLSGALSTRLLSAKSVLDAPNRTSSRLRRHGFRWIQKSVAR